MGKTPCATAFFQPIKTLEYKAFKAWKRACELAAGETPPARRQSYVDDATVEALGEALADNSRGIMWRKDELSGLIADMDKYTKSAGSTRSRLLSAYDGQEWKTSRIMQQMHPLREEGKIILILSDGSLYKTIRDTIGDLPLWPEGEFHPYKFHGHYLTRNRKRGWDEQSFTIVANASHVPLHPHGMFRWLTCGK